jgi:hypothetical protein
MEGRPPSISLGPFAVSASGRVAQMKATRMDFSHANAILFIFGCIIVLSERYLFEAQIHAITATPLALDFRWPTKRPRLAIAYRPRRRLLPFRRHVPSPLSPSTTMLPTMHKATSPSQSHAIVRILFTLARLIRPMNPEFHSPSHSPSFGQFTFLCRHHRLVVHSTQFT